MRVVDLTNVLAGPYCSYQLVLLGAEVVKVEIPGRGDLARRLGADEELNRSLLGTSFLAQNAGKKSVELDLKTDEGREQLTHLLTGADVLLENFRPGVLGRLGFSWDRLQEINERLVYCAISGFGQTGPLRDRPAYDQIIQGLSGMMSVTGTAETAPLRAGFPVCDTLGGLAAALAISAAIAGRARTGRGCQIDVSLLEVAISAMGWVVSNFLATGVEPQPMANENFTAAPSGTFEAADGLLNIAANQQDQFDALCRVVERPDLAADRRFRTAASRKEHRPALKRELDAALGARPAA
ncbi:MAG: CaiB/BaiF CoA transferase family protein, partial [Gaiellaceae bacterium]